eukprot:g10520.t1
MSVLIFVLVVCLVVGVPDFVMKPLVAMGLIARKHKATARHILVKEESLAVKLKAEIGSELEVFQRKAREFSTCPSGRQGGGLGTFQTGQMVPAFDKVIFSRDNKLGEVHGPVATQFGFHLIWIESREFADDSGGESKDL